MKLTVLNSGSKANGYVLQNDTEALLIECGCPMQEALQAVGFNTAKIVTCLVSHEHSDHAKYIEKYMEYMPVYCSQGTADSINYKGKRRPNVLCKFQKMKLGNFKIQTFDTQHDSKEPFGFIIEHPEIGKMMFVTDTYYIKYRFDGYTNIMLECNYDSTILADNVEKGIIHTKVQERTLRSHMSIDTCIKTLFANDISNVSQIVLLHLSGNNSNAEEFKNKVQTATGKRVHVAKKGLEIMFNKAPF